MLFFKCRISNHELEAVHLQLSPDTYCITRHALGNWHYGVIKAGAFDNLLNILTGETLEDLEYLNEDEFKEITRPLIHQQHIFHGNTGLLN